MARWAGVHCEGRRGSNLSPHRGMVRVASRPRRWQRVTGQRGSILSSTRPTRPTCGSTLNSSELSRLRMVLEKFVPYDEHVRRARIARCRFCFPHTPSTDAPPAARRQPFGQYWAIGLAGNREPPPRIGFGLASTTESRRASASGGSVVHATTRRPYRRPASDDLHSLLQSGLSGRCRAAAESTTALLTRFAAGGIRRLPTSSAHT